jgi:hypothetical protein
MEAHHPLERIALLLVVTAVAEQLVQALAETSTHQAVLVEEPPTVAVVVQVTFGVMAVLQESVYLLLDYLEHLVVAVEMPLSGF